MKTEKGEAMSTIPIEKQIACIKRELGMRSRVYPRRIALEKMTQEKADEELAAMRAVLETLESIQKQNNPDLPFG